MAYHFQGTHLRVMQKFARQSRNTTHLEKSRAIFVLHALPTSVEFVRTLKEAGVDIHSVFVKPYSIDQEALKALKALSAEVSVIDYGDFDRRGTKMVSKSLNSALDKSKRDKRSIFGFDIGGYLLKAVKDTLDSDPTAASKIAGIVEDTTFGHNKYLEAAPTLPVPVLSVARSQLKEIEARFVGRDAVVACDMVLRQQGIMLSGRKALSIGYGMIGRNVANSLRDSDLVVSVYDKRDCRNLHAYLEGFDVNKKNVLLKRADIIFSQTAAPAVSFEEIEECKDGVILASVGSRNTEFDVTELMAQAISCQAPFICTNFMVVVSGLGGFIPSA